MTRYHDQTDRIFVRGVQGAYNLQQELERLRSQPRVRKAKDLKLVDGPQAYSRHYVEPKDGITQTFHLHLEEYSPGGKSQKHGHVNEAAFYILDGQGYEIHDNIRLRLERGRCRDCSQQLCPPALQRQRDRTSQGSGDQNQADVPVPEHVVPANRRGAT